MAAELTDEQIDHETMAFWGQTMPGAFYAAHREYARRIAALATQQATQGAEPVAWCFKYGNNWHYIPAGKDANELREGIVDADGRVVLKPTPGYTEWKPLYTAPPHTAEVTQALQRLHDWAQAMDPKCTYTGDHPIAQARAALQSDQAQAGKGE